MALRVCVCVSVCVWCFPGLKTCPWCSVEPLLFLLLSVSRHTASQWQPAWFAPSMFHFKGISCHFIFCWKQFENFLLKSWNPPKESVSNVRCRYIRSSRHLSASLAFSSFDESWLSSATDSELSLLSDDFIFIWNEHIHNGNRDMVVLSLCDCVRAVWLLSSPALFHPTTTWHFYLVNVFRT